MTVDSGLRSHFSTFHRKAGLVAALVYTGACSAIVIIVVLTLRRQKLEAISERDKAERYAAEADAKSRELKKTFDQLDDEHKHRERFTGEERRAAGREPNGSKAADSGG